jgi:hypothetical protein
MAQAAARALAFGLNTCNCCKSVCTCASCIIIEGGAAFTPLVKFRTLLASNFLTLTNQKLSLWSQSGLKRHKIPIIIMHVVKIINHHAQQMHAHEVHANMESQLPRPLLITCY